MNSKISDKDKKDWKEFILVVIKMKYKKKNKKKIIFDLHGYSLDEANLLNIHLIKKKKIVTGKGFSKTRKTLMFQKRFTPG